MHDHIIDIADKLCRCPVSSPQDNEEVHCGELVGYVDDGAYSFAHKGLPVISSVLNEKYDTLEKWMN